MKKSFQVENVKCSGCANTLKKALKDDFGEVEVDLEKFPREITLEIDDAALENLKLKLRSIGYPLSDDELSTLQSMGAKAKSFVSCAVGKLD
jgi:copper chaperone